MCSALHLIKDATTRALLMMTSDQMPEVEPLVLTSVFSPSSPDSSNTERGSETTNVENDEQNQMGLEDGGTRGEKEMDLDQARRDSPRSGNIAYGEDHVDRVSDGGESSATENDGWRRMEKAKKSSISSATSKCPPGEHRNREEGEGGGRGRGEQGYDGRETALKELVFRSKRVKRKPQREKNRNILNNNRRKPTRKRARQDLDDASWDGAPAPKRRRQFALQVFEAAIKYTGGVEFEQFILQHPQLKVSGALLSTPHTR